MDRTLVRPARCEDSPLIARLFQIASEGVSDYIWSQLAMPGESLLEAGARRYAREGVAFSFENCLIAEQGGAGLGMMHSFLMEKSDEAEEETDPILRPYSELEVPGSLYISGLALWPVHRDRGLGSRFLNLAQDRARQLEADSLSLICFAANAGARRFYERHGFRTTDRREIVPHPAIKAAGEALLMVRPLNAA